MKYSHSKTERERASSSGLVGRFAGQRGKRAGRRRLPSASMEERRVAAHRAATAEHSAVFISALSDHNNMNESAMMGKGGRGRNEKEMIHVD